MDSLPSNPYLRSRAPWTLDLEARARRLFLPPQIRARGRPGRWIWKCDPQNLEFAPPNPRSRAPWALDLGLVPKNIFFALPNPRSRGALDMGSGRVTPKILSLPPQIRARGRPGRWIWGLFQKIFFFALPNFFASPNRGRPRSRALWAPACDPPNFFLPSQIRTRGRSGRWGWGCDSKKIVSLPPQIRARGRRGRWIWRRDPKNVFFFAPPNPRSRAPWTLDLGVWPPKCFFFAPKSALEGALDAGSGNATQKLKKISAERRSDVGMIIRRAVRMLRPRVRAGGCPGGWISEAQPDSSAQIHAWEIWRRDKTKQILLKDPRTLDSEVRPNQKRYFPPSQLEPEFSPYIRLGRTTQQKSSPPNPHTVHAAKQTPRPAPPPPIRGCPGL